MSYKILGPFLLTLLVLNNCGGLKVGIDDETIAAAECIANPDTCDDDDSGDSDTSDTSSSGSDSTDGSGDVNDSSGGVGYMEDGNKGGSRYFMGTYSQDTQYYYMNDCSSEYGNNYELPGVIRAYAYDDGGYVDFEDNFGRLAWTATVYQDDTFDFAVQFLDQFGEASNLLACTCSLEAEYSYSDTDVMACTCDPSSFDDDSCKLRYKEL